MRGEGRSKNGGGKGGGEGRGEKRSWKSRGRRKRIMKSEG